MSVPLAIVRSDVGAILLPNLLMTIAFLMYHYLATPRVASVVDVAGEMAEIEDTLMSCENHTNPLVQAMTVAEAEGRLAILETVATAAQGDEVRAMRGEATRVRGSAMKQLSRRMRRAKR